MGRCMQLTDTYDVQQVAADAANPCPHCIQHVTELLDIGFAGCIINRGGTLRHDCCHDDIGGTCDRSLVEQHIGAPQLFRLNLKHVALFDMYEIRTQEFETQEVGIQTTATDLVATRLCDDSLAEATQQRTNHQHTASQGGTFLDEFVTLQVFQIQFIGLKRIVVARVACNLHAHICQQPDEVVDVEDIRDIVYAHLFMGEQSGTDHLQSLVLRSLRHNGSAETVSAFDDK